VRDIEERLRTAQLQPAPEHLDRSIGRMIRWSESEGRSHDRTRRPVWFAAAGCAAGLLAGVVLGPLLRPVEEPDPTRPARVVVIEPTPELERWVGGRDHHARGGFFERAHGELEPLYVAGATPGQAPNTL
jgi:hypothetical protein